MRQNSSLLWFFVYIGRKWGFTRLSEISFLYCPSRRWWQQEEALLPQRINRSVLVSGVHLILRMKSKLFSVALVGRWWLRSRDNDPTISEPGIRQYFGCFLLFRHWLLHLVLLRKWPSLNPTMSCCFGGMDIHGWMVAMVFMCWRCW